MCTAEEPRAKPFFHSRLRLDEPREGTDLQVHGPRVEMGAKIRYTTVGGLGLGLGGAQPKAAPRPAHGDDADARYAVLTTVTASHSHNQPNPRTSRRKSLTPLRSTSPMTPHSLSAPVSSTIPKPGSQLDDIPGYDSGDDFINVEENPDLPPGASAVTSIASQPGDAVKNASEEEVHARSDDAHESADGRRDPPWCPPGTEERLRKLRSPLVRLHAEIIDFCRFLEPTQEEAARREASVTRVRAAVLSLWPEARFEVHGSFATGMYLPNSDIDAVILGSGCQSPATCLKALAIMLSRQGAAQKIQLISKARVPIVKFEEIPSGFQFDVSFDVANGPASAEIVRANMRRFPALRPLTTVLKAFLQQRALNEVYTGGIGSYALLCMVMAHLQLHDASTTASAWAGASGGEAAAEGCLGALLIDFFELYGRRINTDEVGVSCRDGGKFFAKRDLGWADQGRPFLLSIEDPQDPTNDLGRSSYGARQIKSAFEHAFTLMTAPVVDRKEFLLRRIVQMDRETLRGRQPPAEPGAIAGVSADFARYAFAGHLGGDDGRTRVQKRKAGATPQKDNSDPEDDSDSDPDVVTIDDDTADDYDEEEDMNISDEDGEDEEGEDDSSEGDSEGESGESDSSGGSPEEGQVRRDGGSRGGVGKGKSRREGLEGSHARKGGGKQKGDRGRNVGQRSQRNKTPAGKRRRKGGGGNTPGGRGGYFSKGRPGGGGSGDGGGGGGLKIMTSRGGERHVRY